MPKPSLRCFKIYTTITIQERNLSNKMAKSLAKVQKKVAKKKGNSNSLHENSRDAQKLRRAGARSEKLDRLAAARAKANQPHCQEAFSDEYGVRGTDSSK